MKENMNILVALDFSEDPEIVLKEAVSIADKYKSTIYIVHILEDLPHISFYSDAYKLWEEFRDKAVKETITKMQGYIKEFIGEFKEVEAIVEVGEKADKIVELSDRLNIDMIILGHHVRSGLQQLLHKSVSEHVVREAKKPVLTYYIPPKND